MQKHTYISTDFPTDVTLPTEARWMVETGHYRATQQITSIAYLLAFDAF